MSSIGIGDRPNRLPDVATRRSVGALLTAIRDRPAELPLLELVELSKRPVAVAVDRRGEEAVVWVSPRPASCFDALSPREFEVATLLAAGFSNQQLADTLFISLATVKDHVHSILAKTGCASRSAVVAAWYGEGGSEPGAGPGQT